MSRVSLRAWNPVEVEFYGSLFETVDLPEAKSKKVKEIEDRFRQLSEDDAPEEEFLDGMWEWFDLILRPVEGGTKKPSTVLKAKYKAQELTPRQVANLRLDIEIQAARENAGPESEMKCPHCGEAITPGASDRPT